MQSRNHQKKTPVTLLAMAVGLALAANATAQQQSSAAGATDLFWEFLLKPWDTAAGVLLVQEAGGTVSRLDGTRWVPGAADLLATNGRLHEAAVRLLA